MSERRRKSKKRKLKASFDFAASNCKKIKIDQSPSPEDKTKQSQVTVKDELYYERIQKIRQELKRRQKESMKTPKMFLTSVGDSADLHKSERSPIFISDVQTFVLYSVIEIRSPFRPRWCKLLRQQWVSHSIAVIVEGVSINDITSLVNSDTECENTAEQISQILPRITSLLPHQLELMTFSHDSLAFVDEFINVPISGDKSYRLFKGEDDLRIYQVPITSQPIKKEETKKFLDDIKSECFDRRDLLISIDDMITLKYPLQRLGSPGYHDSKFKCTKDEYMEVSSSSPMFGIDCEWCGTSSGQNELTSLSLVNEQHEVVYHTLVKPYNKITSYKTKYSGITSTKLKNICTRLEDVQNALRSILPPDAILVGHSLDGDLRMLKLFHPYCIDTSLIYNLTGDRSLKAGLKVLSKMFLNEIIQTGVDGHDPSEDALASLKLVQLKLTKDIHFANVAIGGKLDFFENACSVFAPVDLSKNQPKKDPNSPSLVKYVSSIFQHAKSMERKLALLSTPMGLHSYDNILKHIRNSIDIIETAPGNKQLSRRMAQVAIDTDFALAHFKMELSLAACKNKEEKLHQFKKLDKRLKYIFESAAEKSVITVIFTGSFSDVEKPDGSNGIVLAGVKKPQEIL